MDKPKPHIKAFFVQAVVDHPPGSARHWPGQGQQAFPRGRTTEAELTVAADHQGEAIEAARRLLQEAGHAWAWLSQVRRTTQVEDQAAELVQEALERAAYDARAERARKGE
jgi:hypothetical protein